jgi:hypothetical protein
LPRVKLVGQLKLKHRLLDWLEKLPDWLYLPDIWAFGGFLDPLARTQMQGLALKPSVLLIGAA